MSMHVIISLSIVTVGIGLYLYMLAYMKKAKNVKLQFPIDVYITNEKYPTFHSKSTPLFSKIIT